MEAKAEVEDPVGYLRATVVNLCRSRIRRAMIARRHPHADTPDVDAEAHPQANVRPHIGLSTLLSVGHDNLAVDMGAQYG